MTNDLRGPALRVAIGLKFIASSEQSRSGHAPLGRFRRIAELTDESISTDLRRVH
jgi:hypothetical protein